MQNIKLLLLLSLISLATSTKFSVVIGHSGVGKSTFLKGMKVLKAETIKTGDFVSTTEKCEKYKSNKQIDPYFDDLYFIDTPGLRDTTGKTDEEISEEIITILLKLSQEEIVDKIDSFILIFKLNDTRFHLETLLIENLIPRFQEKILENLIIILNYEGSENVNRSFKFI